MKIPPPKKLEYADFIIGKSQLGNDFGFKPNYLPDFLFDFQKDLLEWGIARGRAGTFADCGLGKTPMELVWAENVVRHTNKPVLIITPLAVSAQHCREGEKFGIDIQQSKDGSAKSNITVTNYEQLHKFNPDDFAGAACDESSILKSFDGVRKQEITIFMRKMQYRSLWTATAAPNDYLELGTSSEALGYMGYMDMLGRFFKSTQGDNSFITKHGGRHHEATQWRFKGHAELPFWKWVCSWARAIRKPSDLGYSDDKFKLPPLIEKQHVVKTNTLAPEYLFALPAHGLKEQREERRRSIKERCDKVAELCSKDKQPSLIWCHLNDEGDLLEDIISGSIQVSGKDSDEVKEERLLAFANGEIPNLITKQKIAGLGLNYQVCHHVNCFPSHSYEQYYQGVRRCWRFGQTQPVTVNIITTEGELDVLKNLQRKATQADRMFDNLVREMRNAFGIETNYKPTLNQEIPTWL